MLGLLLILISKSWGCPPRVGHAFPRQRHMPRGVGVGGVFISARVFLAIHGWMTRRMDDETDGWMNLVPNAQVCYFNNVWFMF